MSSNNKKFNKEEMESPYTVAYRRYNLASSSDEPEQIEETKILAIYPGWCKNTPRFIFISPGVADLLARKGS